MANAIPSPERLKEKAKIIRKFLNEKYATDISHGHSLELISQVFGFKDWNTASATSKSDAEKVKFPIEIGTVGELKKALENFTDDQSVDADFEFQLKDLLENLDEDDSHEDRIHQTFELTIEKHEPDILSFKLRLENEDLYSDDGQRITGRTLR